MLALVVLAVAGAGAFWLGGRPGEPVAGDSAGKEHVEGVEKESEKEPEHPDVWDARVREYVDAVEEKRGLEFEHPVYVDFMGVAAFKMQVITDEEDLTDEDREEIERATGLFRALGLVEGDLDLFDTVSQLLGSGILGYYSFDDERVRIRGTELTPTVQSTLVHELTHALQDQHFDLGKRRDDLDKGDDSAASSGFDALVEGDASRIETAWRDQLTPQDRKALDRSQAEESKRFEEDSAGIPEVFQTLISSPYMFGEALLHIAVQQGGNQAVNGLFRSPPTTEEHQLDPWTLVEDHEEALDVPEPDLEEGEKEFEAGPFGATSWMLVLAERIPVEQALTAADGWAGDAYVGFERDGTSCVKVNYAGETRQDLDEMYTALTAWTERLPGAPASVRLEGATLAFESCDPGTEAAAVATGGSEDAVSLALSRTYMSATLVDTGVPTPFARCSADLLVREFSSAELNDPSLDPQRVMRALAPCRR